MPKAFVLAGDSSGCGKTSLALGLMAAFSRRGLRVAPFKAGPDYIDPGLHRAACGRESHNLDTWMLPEASVRRLFARHAAGCDVAVVEGVMGLFDGRYEPQAQGAQSPSEPGSTAHLAKVLGLPVLLAVDARSRARSAAALAQGFLGFDPELAFAGVVVNRSGSERHAAMLRQAFALVPQAPLLGVLPRAEGLALPSRHLGLVTAADLGEDELAQAIGRLADWVEANLDLDALLAALPEAGLDDVPNDLPDDSPEKPGAPVRARIGLARDAAFSFVYAENLRLLAAAGAELVPFSPLADAALPEGLDGLLLPGGYPEMHAEALAENAAMRQAVRAFCASGKPVWAECGGYMYLARALVDAGGRELPMCGVLPVRAVMQARRSSLGYREARTVGEGILGPEGTALRGHEFHYSHMEPLSGADLEGAEGGSLGPALALTGGERTILAGVRRGNLLASYFHAHLGSNPGAARAFVDACARR